jgi:hypothetical protein
VDQGMTTEAETTTTTMTTCMINVCRERRFC